MKLLPADFALSFADAAAFAPPPHAATKAGTARQTANDAYAQFLGWAESSGSSSAPTIRVNKQPRRKHSSFYMDCSQEDMLSNKV
jgi:hypothetical protein